MRGDSVNGGPGLATTRTGSLARVMTNSQCQRGLALLKLKGHPVGISEVCLTSHDSEVVIVPNSRSAPQRGTLNPPATKRRRGRP